MDREAIFRHLSWYLTTRPTPQGGQAAYGIRPAAMPKTPRAPEAAPEPTAAPHAPPAPQASGYDLGILIQYLDTEINDKELGERAAQWRHDPEVLKRRTCEGSEAMDAYVYEIVAALRDFPYLNIREGREAGCWIRDEVVASMFRGHWDFYNNRKLAGFNLEEFHQLLSGQNMLLDRLRHAREQLQMVG